MSSMDFMNDHREHTGMTNYLTDIPIQRKRISIVCDSFLQCQTDYLCINYPDYGDCVVQTLSTINKIVSILARAQQARLPSVLS